MAITPQTKLSASSVRKTPFVKRGLFIWVIVLGLIGMVFAQQTVVSSLDAAKDPAYPIIGLGIVALATAVWLGVEKVLRRPNELPYGVRASSLLVFIIVLAGLTIWHAGGLNLKYGLIASETEHLLAQTARTFGWPLMAASVIFALIGLAELWRFLFFFIPLAAITTFVAFGIFGVFFHLVWIGVVLVITVFGGVTWVVQQAYNRRPVRIRYLWIGLLAGLAIWLPVSAVIAKLQSTGQGVYSPEAQKTDCTAEQFIPALGGQKRSDYIPGVVKLEFGRVLQSDDAKLLSTVEEAGVANARIGQREILTPGAPDEFISEVYLEVPAPKTVEAACTLSKRNNNGLFGQVELLSKKQFCRPSLKNDPEVAAEVGNFREVAEYSRALCDKHAPGWDQGHFES